MYEVFFSGEPLGCRSAVGLEINILLKIIDTILINVAGCVIIYTIIRHEILYWRNICFTHRAWVMTRSIILEIRIYFPILPCFSFCCGASSWMSSRKYPGWTVAYVDKTQDLYLKMTKHFDPITPITIWFFGMMIHETQRKRLSTVTWHSLK